MNTVRQSPTRAPLVFAMALASLLLTALAFASDVRAQQIVTNLGNAGPGSLREAIADTAPGGTISFGVSGTIVLASELMIDKDLTIQGNGSITVSGNGNTRVFNVVDGTVGFENLTIADGNVQSNDCGGFSAQCGGGIMVQGPNGVVAVINSTLSANRAVYGAGIMAMGGHLLISNTTFSSNLASFQGGGLYLRAQLDSTPGTATITNSTFTNNSASVDAGGIFNDGSIMTLSHGTFSGNSAGGVGGGVSNRWGSTLDIGNTIIVDSPSGGDCLNSDGSTINDIGNNFVGDGSCGLAAAGELHLMPLDDNGGPTMTMALLPFSPAVGGGSASCAASDQRGMPRGASCDAGAYEVQAADFGNDQCRGDLAQGQTYPFGSTGIQISVDTVGSLSQLCVRLEETSHPDASTGLQTGRHWLVTPTAASSDWTLTMSAPTAFVADNDDRLCRYTGSGGVWDCGGSASTSFTPHRVTRSGITELSAWAVGTESFEVTATTAAGSGTITPASQVVDPGDDASFSVLPDTGWSLLAVAGDTCTPELDQGTGWTAANITEACAVEASFAIDSYVVTASVGSGQGAITPSSQSIDHGADATFSVVPDTGWSVTTVSGDTCTPTNTSGTTWVAPNVTEACAVTANFALDTFAVSATVSAGQGSITPPSQSVDFGGTASFTVTPDAGWSVDSVAGNTCTPVLVAGGAWQAPNIQADCAVQAGFVINSYAVTAAVGSGDGTITPPSQSVDHGSNASFTVTPDSGWSVTTVSGDTCTPTNTSGTSWVASDITGACAVTANFALDTFAVSAAVSAGQGTITPPTQNVDFDGTASFTVTPDAGWSVDSVAGNTCAPVLVTGDAWQAPNIQADCAVEARFVINSYAVTAVAAGDGSITPTSQQVEHGSSATFTVMPDTDWTLSSVTGDTCQPTQGPGNQWTAANIVEACAVTASFAEDSFTVGGSVSGLVGGQLLLQNNGVDEQTIAANGGFTFTPQANGSSYEVTVSSQPAGQFCSITNGSGTLAGADVDDVDVACAAIALTMSQLEIVFPNAPGGVSRQQLLTLTNSGSGALVIEDITAPGAPFSIDASGCSPLPLTLAVGESCTVIVIFDGSGAGTFTDEIVVVSNALGSPDVVPIRGTAVPAPTTVPVMDKSWMAALILLTMLLAGRQILVRGRAGF